MTEPLDLDALAEELRAAGYYVDGPDDNYSLDNAYEVKIRGLGVSRNDRGFLDILANGEVLTDGIELTDWPAIRIIDRHLVRNGIASPPAELTSNKIGKAEG
jgi:hypothetical protein